MLGNAEKQAFPNIKSSPRVFNIPIPSKEMYNPSSEDAIYVKDLCKSFGDVCAVQNLSFRVRRGTVFGLLGKNGSGKSTTAKLLTGLLKPASGSIYINGIT